MVFSFLENFILSVNLYRLVVGFVFVDRIKISGVVGDEFLNIRCRLVVCGLMNFWFKFLVI